MSRRLVIVADRTDTSGTEAITEAIRASGASWWHWLRPVWLLVDPDDRPPSWWREHLHERVSGAQILILDAEGDGRWAMRGPADGFDWLHDTWRPARD